MRSPLQHPTRSSTHRRKRGDPRRDIEAPLSSSSLRASGPSKADRREERGEEKRGERRREEEEGGERRREERGQRTGERREERGKDS